MNQQKAHYLKLVIIVPMFLFLFACGDKKTEEQYTEKADPEVANTTDSSPVNKELKEKTQAEPQASIEAEKPVTKQESPKESVHPSKEQEQSATRNSAPDEMPTSPEEHRVKEEVETPAPEEVITEQIEDETPQEPEIAKQTLPNHTSWDKLTREFVTEAGNVDYDGFRKNRAEIKGYITQLKNLPPQPDWSGNQELAYWINLYNALTVDLILEHYPIKTIMNINRGKAWDLEVVNIEDKAYSLNNIENDIIRKNFKEPRIHFAVNCAATSCPKLLNGAFLPEQLDEQLESQAIYFINNKDKNQVSQGNTNLSKIFDWYGADFGDIKTYIARYHKAFDPEASVNFLEYDWQLNK